MHLTHETRLIDVWNDFARMLIRDHPEITPKLLNVLKRSMYAGAITMFALMERCASPEISDEDTDFHLKRLLDEMNRYFQDEIGIQR